MELGSTVGPGAKVVGHLLNKGAERRLVIHRLFMQMADRRMLFDGHCGTNCLAMIKSAKVVRASLTAAASEFPTHPGAISYIRYSRLACHRFQTFLEAYPLKEIQGVDPEVAHELEQLRHAIRHSAEWLGQTFDVELPEELKKSTAPR
jgi:hypothetical protein